MGNYGASPKYFTIFLLELFNNKSASCDILQHNSELVKCVN
jgi:hypothetical protein